MPNALYDFLVGRGTEKPLAHRSSLLPIGTYENGDGTESAGWAWPQMSLDAKEASEIPGRYLSGDPSQAVTQDDAQRTAINAAGMMMGGGLLAPKRAVATNAETTAARGLSELPQWLPETPHQVATDLPMDHASRMARAKAMGFNTDKTYYHGTTKNFDEFNPSNDYNALGSGVYLSPDVDGFAQHFGSEVYGAGRIMPLYVKNGKMFDYDWTNPEKTTAAAEAVLPGVGPSIGRYHMGDMSQPFNDALRQQGYDGINLKYNEGADVFSETNVFDPRNIRSVNAAFDPRKSESANILFSNGSPLASGIGAGLLENNRRSRSLLDPTIY